MLENLPEEPSQSVAPENFVAMASGGQPTEIERSLEQASPLAVAKAMLKEALADLGNAVLAKGVEAGQQAEQNIVKVLEWLVSPKAGLERGLAVMAVYNAVLVGGIPLIQHLDKIARLSV